MSFAIIKFICAENWINVQIIELHSPSTQALLVNLLGRTSYLVRMVLEVVGRLIRRGRGFAILVVPEEIYVRQRELVILHDFGRDCWKKG